MYNKKDVSTFQILASLHIIAVTYQGLPIYGASPPANSSELRRLINGLLLSRASRKSGHRLR